METRQEYGLGIGGCRRNIVGSLPRGMPKVVDCRQTDAQTTNKMVTQDTRGFIQVQPPRRRNTYVLRLIVLLYVNEMCFFRGVPCPPYIVWGTGLQI